MQLLKNIRGIKHGEYTKPVAMSFSFLNALFNIEQNYHNKEDIFTLGDSGKKRLLNHVTEADLCVATVLFVICSTNGRINNITRNAIYEKLVELYEDPISNPQFYESLEKLKRHNLIVEEQKGSGVVSYALQHFNQEEEETFPWLKANRKKLERFFLLHPVVFTAAFTDLPLSHKKLFYSVAAQQGDKADKTIQRLLVTLDHNVQFSGLSKFLHKQHPYQVAAVLNELTEKKMGTGNPLFSIARVEKVGRKEYKAYLQIHSSFICKHEKGTEYREGIQPRFVYRRTTKYIQKILSSWKLEELISKDELNDLVLFCKGKGYRFIRPALEIVQRYYKKNKNLPGNVVAYLAKTIRSKTAIIIMDIAKRTGIDTFISGGKTAEDDIEEREDSFVNALSQFSFKQIESACRKAAQSLKTNFTGLKHYDLNEYSSPNMANTQEIRVVRDYAWRHQKDPQAYIQLERIFAPRLLSAGSKVHNVLEEMIEKVINLPDGREKIVPPISQPVEEYIISNYLSA